MPSLLLRNQQISSIKFCKVPAGRLQCHTCRRRKFTDRQCATVHQRREHVCTRRVAKQCGNGSYDRAIFHTSMLTEL